MPGLRPPIISEAWRPATGLLAVIAVALAAAGCRWFGAERPAYGLPTVEIEIESENYARLNANVWAKVPVPARLRLDGRNLRGDVAYAGKSTIDAYKKNWDLTLGPGETHRGRDEWRLMAGVLDQSGIKTRIGLEIYASAGVEVSETASTALYVNGEYRGLYTLIEPVDTAFFKRRGLAVGGIFKAQYGDATFDESTAVDPAGAFSDKHGADQYSEIRRLTEAVSAPVSDASRTELARLVDIDRYLTYMAVSVLLNNWDGYTNNFVMVRSAGAAPYRIVPWDLDRLWDTTEGHDVYVPGRSPWGAGALARRVFADPDWRASYVGKVRDLLTTSWPVARITGRIDELAGEIAAAFAADRVLAAGGRTGKDEAAALKTAVEAWIGSLAKDFATGPAEPDPSR